MSNKNISIKQYLQWIITTYENIPIYDDLFERGKTVCDGWAVISPNETNYGFLYITPYLIVNTFELLKQIKKYKDDANYFESFKQYLLNTFGITYNSESLQVVQKIISSDIFNGYVLLQQREEKLSYYEALHLARNAISHANFNQMLSEMLSGINLMDDVVAILKTTII